ncbi:dTDP-4-amino-4,6-dideoxygalactose transaminase [Verrucomicrobiota bacterium]
MKIPFNKPYLTGTELRYMEEAVRRSHISGDGHFTKKCSSLLTQILNVPHCLLTTSCTHALEMAGLLLNLGPDDEFIVPAFTFVSTVNAFVLRGAKPVFADIRSDTFNIDETKLEQLITPATKAIVPVHYAGAGCEMDAIIKIANQYKIAVIEDNAHGLFGKYKEKPLGSFGDMATQSFHETKNVSCGEGGALVINNNEYFCRAEIIREKGTDRSRFFRGETDKYTWVDIGSSYLPSDILAAFLLAQLENSEKIQNHRKHIWERYFNELKEWASSHNIRLPFIPDHCEQAYHMFYMFLPTGEHTKKLISHLKENEISAVFHYQPLHLSEMGRKFGGKEGLCPVTENTYSRIIRLPFYNGMSDSEQTSVIKTVKEFDPSGN